MPQQVLTKKFIDGPGGEIDGDGADEIEIDDPEDAERIGI